MIVETMNTKEMAMEYDAILSKLNITDGDYTTDPILNKLRRHILKNKSDRPFFYWKPPKAIDANTHLHIAYFCFSYTDFKKNGMTRAKAITFKRSNGLIGITKGFLREKQRVAYTIYTSHFLKRYRERCLKDESLSYIDTFRKKGESGYEYMGYTQSKDEYGNPKVIIAEKGGISLGIEEHDNILVYKTFISEDDMTQAKQDHYDYLKDYMNYTLDEMREMLAQYQSIKNLPQQRRLF